MKRLPCDCGKSHNTGEGQRRCHAKAIKQADLQREADKRVYGENMSKPKTKVWRVGMQGLAIVKAVLYVEGETEQEAIDKAALKTGDVVWSYSELFKVEDMKAEVA